MLAVKNIKVNKGKTKMKEKSCYNCIHMDVCVYKKDIVKNVKQAVYVFVLGLINKETKTPVSAVIDKKEMFATAITSEAFTYLATNCEEYKVK